jgi:HK97 family phage prohead protease
MKVEIRNDSVHIEGYVNVVERDSRVLPSPHGKFIEQVKAKTFQRALEKTDNVNLLFNHKEDRKLGSTKEGNLKLWEDNIGLRAMADITDATVIEKAKNKELRGWSFAFTTIKDSWEEGKNGIQRRYLEDITLPEVSILSITPAYIATSIESRGEETVITEQRNVEESIEIIDNSTPKEEKKEEKRENPIDYSLYEKEIELLKLKSRY